MSIRPMTADDVTPLCTAVTRLPLLQRYRHTPASLAHDLGAGQARGDRVLVYDEGSGPLGLAWLVTHGTLGLGGYLRLIAVAPEALGRNVGRTLLRGFENVVRQHARHAFLLVSDFNLDAQRFYQQHGYTQVGAMPALVLPEVNELIYWKRLVPSVEP